jgi:hypothetical protein
MAIPVTLIGFDDPAIKNAIEKELIVLTEEHSFRLASLEELTVASDYNEFLVDFDTGFRPREMISATTGENSGMGMTPEVLRKGVLGSHLILSRDIAFPLAHAARQGFHLDAVYTLTHEAAHAEEHLISAEDYGPQIISLHATPDFYLVFGRSCWGEYHASKRAAFSHPEMGATLAEMFLIPINRLESELGEAGSAFKSSSDKQALSVTVTRTCTNLFIHFSRLSGHFDGLGTETPEHLNSNPAFIKRPHLLKHFLDLRRSLRIAHEKIGGWGSLETGLNSVVNSFKNFFSFITA